MTIGARALCRDTHRVLEHPLDVGRATLVGAAPGRALYPFIVFVVFFSSLRSLSAFDQIAQFYIHHKLLRILANAKAVRPSRLSDANAPLLTTHFGLAFCFRASSPF